MYVPLTTGAYQARSLIANAQRCVNLYAEANSPDSPVPFTYYPTPGHKLLSNCPTPGRARGAYRTSTGVVYAVVGNMIYYINSSYQWTQLGTLNGNLLTPVDMSDNGTTLLVVDGTTYGYTVTLSSNVFQTITDPNFVGGVRVGFIDTYFALNQPNTPNFTISGSNAVTFNGLDFAAKTGFSDNIAGLVCLHDEIWLIGTLTTEVWYNSGAADFTFQRQQGVFIEHGTCAPFSICRQDQSVYYVSQDEQGQGIIVKSVGYQQTRISTHAVEAKLATYSTLSDCVAYVFQQNGHTFINFDFPTADRNWTYDEASGQWHERMSIDANGRHHRPLGTFGVFCYGQNLVLDWKTGALYSLDQNTFNDNGVPITRIRSFPHIVNDNKRVTYNKFVADVDCGNISQTLASTPPQISLRKSITHGHSWSDPIMRSMGSTGQYKTQVSWWRMGMGRGTYVIFELSWSIDEFTALNGAYVDITMSAT